MEKLTTNGFPACVGCAFCCRQATCFGGIVEMDKRGIQPKEGDLCAFLAFHDGRYWCELAEELKKQLAIGEGCCSSLNSDRRKMLEAEATLA